MATAKELYELQEIDLDIERKNQSLAQIADKIGKDEQLVAARAGLEAARKFVLDKEHLQRQEESQASELSKKIAVSEKKLFSGSIVNPKELISLQEEVDQLKARRKTHEEKVLELMLEAESGQQEVKQKRDDLKKFEADWQAEQQNLLKEKATAEADLAADAERRNQATSQIDKESLAAYAQLRREKQGRAVARLEQGRCQGCRIGLSMADLQRARSGQSLAKCSNCGRILYLSS